MMCLVILCVLVHVLYWVGLFTRLLWYPVQNEYMDPKDVSIIVCVKNSSDHLRRLLPSLREQGAHEVIVVDDFSVEDIQEICAAFMDIRYIHASSDQPGKKIALFDGIRSATGRYVLLTDVDCYVGKNWASRMRSAVVNNHIVLGYSPMIKMNQFIPYFSRYETFLTVIQYMSYSLVGQTYMGVGRNMLVERTAALKAEKYVLSHDMASGDDDLMVNYLSENHKVGLCLHPESFVYTEPQESIGGFIRQKSRHISTSHTYTTFQKILLGAFSLSHMAFYGLGLLGVLLGSFSVSFFLNCLLVKWLVQMLVAARLCRVYEEGRLWRYIPILDISAFLYLLVLTPYIFVKNRRRWN